MPDNNRPEVHGTWHRKDIVDLLHRAGYEELAAEASQRLPASMPFDEVVTFCRASGISRDELVNRMGGSS